VTSFLLHHFEEVNLALVGVNLALVGVKFVLVEVDWMPVAQVDILVENALVICYKWYY
jgi:hypothetical protein